MGQSFAEKALGRAVGHAVRAGDVVTVYPDWCLSHENASGVLRSFRDLGGERVYDPERIVIVFDHTVPPPTGDYANSQNKLFYVAEAGKHAAGEHYDGCYGFEWVFTHDSYSYTALVRSIEKGEDDGSAELLQY